MPQIKNQAPIPRKEVMNKSIVILDQGLRITDLEVRRKDVADFLRSADCEETEPTLIQAIEVGVFCLERARMGQDTEFVRRCRCRCGRQSYVPSSFLAIQVS